MTPAQRVLSSKILSVVLSGGIGIGAGVLIRRTVPPSPTPGRMEVSPPLKVVHFPSASPTRRLSACQTVPRSGIAFSFTTRPASV